MMLSQQACELLVAATLDLDGISVPVLATKDLDGLGAYLGVVWTGGAGQPAKTAFTSREL